MHNIYKAFGGVHAVEDVSIDLYPGEVVGLVGHNGAGKTTLIKILSGVFQADSGRIYIDGREVMIRNPGDARGYGIETIYQNLALADNLDAPANIFLGRELMRGFALNEDAMEAESRKVLDRLRITLTSLRDSVLTLSGGQRQAVAIGRALYFNARILIMDEPTAALGPAEARQVGQLIKQLKGERVGIFLISHDIHDVFEYADRISVLKTGRLVGTVRKTEVTQDDVLTMIIAGALPQHGVVPPPVSH
ncbi:MAG: ABC transporter ATP-binding protein [Armatimonadetes bacterium 13_1_40CM_64_14]|nr:MAG: ABC transporter ATP-binding protein [Armatimonadetes bacterium 13_1_40CM_64_14]